MNKVNTVRYSFCLFIIICCSACPQFLFAQQTAVNNMPYKLIINRLPADTANNGIDLKLQTNFSNLQECTVYINLLPQYLQAKGFAAASVDSIWQLNDSATAVQLFLGNQYRWFKLTTAGIEPKALASSGYIEKNFAGKNINADQLQQIQSRMLAWYANNGYPFAKIYLDSLIVNGNEINASLMANSGNQYFLDSIRIIGNAKISKNFLQHYLFIKNGSLFSKEKLAMVSPRMLELAFLQEQKPADVTMLGSGALLNIYAAHKKSSQFNFLLGFLPGANQAQKFQLTADVNVNFKNELGTGETFIFNWQQLQQKSPRLNFGWQQPYILKSNFSFDFLFDLFKKDSTFLQVNGQLGIGFSTSVYQFGKMFVQWQNSFLLAAGVDTNLVKATKTLPFNIDVKAANFGVEYNWIHTDYRLNPRKGNEVKLTAVAGIKTIRRNNDILAIKDPFFNYASLYDSVKLKSYQLRIKAYAAHYFAIGKQTTFKTAVNAGLYGSPNIFRNELFQIGGYRLLRGFDEESIYATQYAVGTAEYRVRTALNSYFFIFTDGGVVKNQYQNTKQVTNFFSGGIGAVLETKLGLLNIAYALGKRGDVPFNLRQASKIHFGYVNYF